jgi:hypothetical protein
MWKMQGLNMLTLDVLLKIKLHGQDIYCNWGLKFQSLNPIIFSNPYTTIGMHVGWKGTKKIANDRKVPSWLGVPYDKKNSHAKQKIESLFLKSSIVSRMQLYMSSVA